MGGAGLKKSKEDALGQAGQNLVVRCLWQALVTLHSSPPSLTPPNNTLMLAIYSVRVAYISCGSSVPATTTGYSVWTLLPIKPIGKHPSFCTDGIGKTKWFHGRAR